MSRHPDWFERLDAIVELVRETSSVEWFGRHELKAVFHCSERDSIRLLHKFGAEERDDALRLNRGALLVQLEAIRQGNRYSAFLRHRQQVARQLAAAREQTAARQFRIPAAEPELPARRLEELPATITWRRKGPDEPGRFEIVYRDGADLMRQMARFLDAASTNREEYFAGTEAAEDDAG